MPSDKTIQEADSRLIDHFKLRSYNNKSVAKSPNQLPLPVLHQQLQDSLQRVKADLVDLINQDYADFISLSTKLVGLDARLDGIALPLADLTVQLEGMVKKYEERYENLSKLLEERTQLRQQKSDSVTLLSMQQSLEHLQSLNASQESSVKQLERMATEFNHWHYWLGKYATWPFVKERRPEVEAMERVMLEKLDQYMIQAWTAQSSDRMLEDCLRIYATVGRYAQAERAVVLHELEGAVTTVSDKNKLTCESLETLCSHLISVIDSFWLPIISKTVSAPGAASPFQFYVNGICAEIFRMLTRDLPALFSSAVPDTFQHFFVTAMKFLSQLEDRCVSEEDFKQLRRHEAYQEFIGKWPLTVYYQIRFKEIASAMEDQLTHVPLTIGAASDLGTSPCFNGTKGLLVAFDTIWSDKVFIGPLVARFWRLSLQALLRYDMWLGQNVSRLSRFVDTGSAAANGDSPKSSPGGSPTPKRSGSHESMDGIVMDPAKVSIIAFAMLLDMQTAREKLTESYQAAVVGKLGAFHDETRQSLNDSFDTWSVKHGHALSDLIISLLVRLCADSLKLIKNIPAQYRRTNREPPTKFSFFVPQILKPLQYFQDETRRMSSNETITKELLRPWVIAILDQVAKLYASKTSELLAHVKTIEDSLKRLQQKKTASTSSAQKQTQLSDEDKIRLQLNLDAKQFCEECRVWLGQFEPNGDLEQLVPSIQELMRVVEEAISANATNS